LIDLTPILRQENLIQWTHVSQVRKREDTDSGNWPIRWNERMRCPSGPASCLADRRGGEQYIIAPSAWKLAPGGMKRWNRKLPSQDVCSAAGQVCGSGHRSQRLSHLWWPLRCKFRGFPSTQPLDCCLGHPGSALRLGSLALRPLARPTAWVLAPVCSTTIGWRGGSGLKLQTCASDGRSLWA
jgi:hypothetical protein